MILPLTNKTLKSLTNQNFIADFLHCDRRTLNLLKSDSMYNIFVESRKGKKDRKIQAPKDLLKMAQKILQKELARETLPEWVMCAKNRGHIKNAHAHAGQGRYVIKLDITNFYGSCQAQYIFNLFNHRDGYGLSKGVSTTLTQIVTYRGFLPTGAPTSPYLAFWAYRQCFDEIYRITQAHNFYMTLFADDITLSFYRDARLSCYWIQQRIKEILERYDLNFNNSKTRFYSANRIKSITGIPVGEGILLPPNKTLKKIHDERYHSDQCNDEVIKGCTNYLKAIEKENHR